MDNQLYFRTCAADGLPQHSDAATVALQMLDLLQVAELPDMEFMFHGGDYPLCVKTMVPPMPILTWTTSGLFHEVAWPSGEHYTQVMTTATAAAEAAAAAGAAATATATATASSSALPAAAAAAAAVPWNQKQPKAFWRGALTGPDQLPAWAWDASWRTVFMTEAARHPSLFDCAFTNVDDTVVSPKDMAAAAHLFPLKAMVADASSSAAPKFKYLPNVDGVTSAWRLTALLGSGSVVLQQPSPSSEFFQPLLRPHRHYQPVRADMSDVVAQVTAL